MKLLKKRKRRYNRKTDFLCLFLIVIVGSMSLGYATLTQGLSILGRATINTATWDVHFANVQPVSGSVPVDNDPTITENDTKVTFSAILNEPGELYSFTVDVVNAGGIDAMIDDIKISPELTTAQKKYLNFTVAYIDDTPLEINQRLVSGDTKTIKVYFKYVDGLDNSSYPKEDQEFNFTLELDFIQASEIVPVFDAQEWTKSAAIGSMDLGASASADYEYNGPTDVTPDNPAYNWGSYKTETKEMNKQADGTYSYTWIFQTNVSANYSGSPGGWMLKSFEVNGTNVPVPLIPVTIKEPLKLTGETANGVEQKDVTYTETILPNGTKVKIEYLCLFVGNNGKNAQNQRIYRITISNARTDVTITGGSLELYS